jgi:NADP-dependent 3-hydroxy acid dehydrogenase YdfG
MAALQGKTLIITGASPGIGRALVLELAGIGVKFVLNARHAPAFEEAALPWKNYPLTRRRDDLRKSLLIDPAAPICI